MVSNKMIFSLKSADIEGSWIQVFGNSQTCINQVALEQGKHLTYLKSHFQASQKKDTDGTYVNFQLAQV